MKFVRVHVMYDGSTRVDDYIVNGNRARQRKLLPTPFREGDWEVLVDGRLIRVARYTKPPQSSTWTYLGIILHPSVIDDD